MYQTSYRLVYLWITSTVAIWNAKRKSNKRNEIEETSMNRKGKLRECLWVDQSKRSLYSDRVFKSNTFPENVWVRSGHFQESFSRRHLIPLCNKKIIITKRSAYPVVNDFVSFNLFFKNIIAHLHLFHKKRVKKIRYIIQHYYLHWYITL